MADDDKLRIVSDGTPFGTDVYIGNEHLNVPISKVECEISVNSMATARITFLDVELDLEVERDAVAMRRERDDRPRKEVKTSG